MFFGGFLEFSGVFWRSLNFPRSFLDVSRLLGFSNVFFLGVLAFPLMFTHWNPPNAA